MEPELLLSAGGGGGGEYETLQAGGIFKDILPSLAQLTGVGSIILVNVDERKVGVMFLVAGGLPCPRRSRE
jgi:hypothetical protein